MGCLSDPFHSSITQRSKSPPGPPVPDELLQVLAVVGRVLVPDDVIVGADDNHRRVGSPRLPVSQGGGVTASRGHEVTGSRGHRGGSRRHTDINAGSSLAHTGIRITHTLHQPCHTSG